MEDKKIVCQCCGMPLTEELMAKNPDGTTNEKYCKWCYVDGKYAYDDMDILIDTCVKHMVGDNFTEEQARTYMKGILPELEYWKNKK